MQRGRQCHRSVHNEHNTNVRRERRGITKPAGCQPRSARVRLYKNNDVSALEVAVQIEMEQPNRSPSQPPTYPARDVIDWVFMMLVSTNLWESGGTQGGFHVIIRILTSRSRDFVNMCDPGRGIRPIRLHLVKATGTAINPPEPDALNLQGVCCPFINAIVRAPYLVVSSRTSRHAQAIHPLIHQAHYTSTSYVVWDHRSLSL